MMLVSLLRLAFVDAQAVGTAAQALSLIQAEHFDLYMLDGWLPEINGFELCRRLRALDSRTPILFFSGAAYEADKKNGFEAGADDYVVKPNISELVRSVKQFMSRDVKQPVRREIQPLAEVLPVGPASITSTIVQVRPQLTQVNLRGVPSHGSFVD
jgi:DNA-binding response OmpR family regulator